VQCIEAVLLMAILPTSSATLSIAMPIDDNSSVLATVPDRVGTVRQHLRQATHAAHVRLNHHPMLAGLTRAGFLLPQYRTILSAYRHFYAAVEPAILALLSQASDHEGFSYADRSKLPWLIADILALGDTPPSLASGRAIGVPTDAAELVGTLYAIEGSTLGGQVISRHLANNLGLTPERGARFFNGYGADTEKRWADFCLYAERLVDDPMQFQRAGVAALQAFTDLEDLLDDCQ
jgi:heme oxygenase (biliverdin-IX-beta and delta-forming)